MAWEMKSSRDRKPCVPAGLALLTTKEVGSLQCVQAKHRAYGTWAVPQSDLTGKVKSINKNSFLCHCLDGHNP